MRAATRTIGASALVVASVALVTGPAEAAAYRYWTYWQAPAGTTAWAFATEGPGTSVPSDGDVEGWSFGITTESGSLDDAPATAADFAMICAGSAPSAGQKRVALVVDTGVAGIGPAGQSPPGSIVACVQAAPEATGYEILRSVADVRVENGLVCGIAGYPVGECAPVLDDAEAADLLAATTPAPDAAPTPAMPSVAATPAPTTADTGMAAGTADPAAGGSSTPWATLAVGVLLIGGAAFWYARGRRGH